MKVENPNKLSKSEELALLKDAWCKLPQWHQKVVFYNPRKGTWGCRIFTSESNPSYGDYAEYLKHHNISFLCNGADVILYYRDGVFKEYVEDLLWN